MKKTKNLTIFSKLCRNILPNESLEKMNNYTLNKEEMEYLEEKHLNHRGRHEYIIEWAVRKGFVHVHLGRSVCVLTGEGYKAII
jgi:hypothetical protein